MASTVQKCGNSLAVRIPNALAVATIVSGRSAGEATATPASLAPYTRSL